MDEPYEDYCERMRDGVTKEQMESAAKKYEFAVVPMLYFGQEAPDNALHALWFDLEDGTRFYGWVVPVTEEQLGHV